MGTDTGGGTTQSTMLQYVRFQAKSFSLLVVAGVVLLITCWVLSMMNQSDAYSLTINQLQQAYTQGSRWYTPVIPLMQSP